MCMLARMCVCVRARLGNNSSLVSYASACLSAFFFFLSLSLLSCNNVSAYVQGAKRNTHILSLYLSVSHILFSSLFLSVCERARVRVLH